MTDIWFTSDTHFGHENILKFDDEHGDPIRNFSDANEMDEFIIQKWNSVVSPQDHVWHLGDVAFCSTGRLKYILSHLNGHKRLCVGNHDYLSKQSGKILYDFFDKIVLWNTTWVKDGFICAHVPMRAEQIKGKAQVHGHIHQNVIDDPRYINVCVEVCNYTPIHIDEIIQKVKAIT